MVPGGNIATSWSTGSVLLASVGTITAVCGNKVFAYGHPDENIGESHQTMHSASTVQIQADGPGSFKMVNINPEPAGALLEDGNNGVFGVLGQATEDSIPVTTNASYGTRTQSHASAVSEPNALSTVIANQVYGEVSAVLGNSGSGAANVSWTVTYRREGSTTDEVYSRSHLVTSLSAFPEYAIEGPAGDVAVLPGGEGRRSEGEVALDLQARTRRCTHQGEEGLHAKVPGGPQAGVGLQGFGSRRSDELLDVEVVRQDRPTDRVR